MIDPVSMAPLDDDFIDRIVDGGLTPAELRAVLDRLDRAPDGWKRCALAFLEAQCWGESFRAIEPTPRVRVAAETPQASRAEAPGRRRSSEWRRLGIAAGIAMVSFAMGWAVHPARPSAVGLDRPTPVAPAIADHPETPISTEESPEVADASEALGEFARQPGPDRRYMNPGDLVAVGGMDPRFDRESDQGPILDDRWFGDQPPRVDAHQQALLERQGYRVDQHRRIITATMADGRRVTVPIDQVQVRFTGNAPL